MCQYVLSLGAIFAIWKNLLRVKLTDFGAFKGGVYTVILRSLAGNRSEDVLEMTCFINIPSLEQLQKSSFVSTSFILLQAKGALVRQKAQSKYMYHANKLMKLVHII